MKCKEKVKKLWKENKELIVGGALVLVSAGVGVYLWKKPIKPIGHSADFNGVLEMCECVDSVKGNADMYIPVTGEEFAKLSENDILRDPSGTMLKVTGAIAFGNVVEE